MNRRLWRLGLVLALAALAPAPEEARDRAIGKSYQVPYRLTETNHFLVRVRINGKGPFNFLVDTGAPALYISTDTAKKIDLTASKTSFWTPVDRVEFEGGARLDHVKARVEDPFQLIGMNALGLPGASIDGILGFTILARFKLELDPTRDRMTWTRLDYEPKEPPVPDRAERDAPPAEMGAMNMLGPLAKFAAKVVGKQPEEQLHPRGFFGLEIAEKGGEVRVTRVLADSPAARAGVKAGDRLLEIQRKQLGSVKVAREIVAEIKPGDRVPLVIGRDSGKVDVSLTAGEGF
ncbi:aspartyl protease family protein [Singulisphaera sp. PoT]|uniref:aspartyl protease family protein n=1 Tax=Singulisphaera sp. PoT TaxID=3411797 RepID=UPI003BF531D2